MNSSHSFRRATRFIAVAGLVVAAACADSGEPLLAPEAADSPRFGNTLIGSGNSVSRDTASTVVAGGNSGGH